MISKNALYFSISVSFASLFGCSSDTGDMPIGSVLPIRVGIYVDESQTCADPANAGILSYDGEGLSGAHTHDCHMIIDSHQGKLFAYTQRCVDSGIGDGPISTEKGFMTITSDKLFLLQRGSGKTAFSYCQPSAPPSGIPVPQSK